MTAGLLAPHPPLHSRVARRSPADTTEAALVETISRQLKALFPIRAFGTEIRSHGRCRTDICLVARDFHTPNEQGLVLGVEVKLTDTKRALRQAILNRYAVDGSLVAMPSQRISLELIGLAREHGIGILAVGPDGLSVVLPAALNRPDSSLRRRMVEQLAGTRPRGKASVALLVGERRLR